MQVTLKSRAVSPRRATVIDNVIFICAGNIHNGMMTCPCGDLCILLQYLADSREFGIRNTIKKLNRQLEKVADSFGNITDI